MNSTRLKSKGFHYVINKPLEGNMDGYPNERLAIIEAMVKKGLDVKGGRPWAIDPRELRFRHGESIAELKVPYHMGSEDESCVEDAILSLLSLFNKRYEKQSEGAEPQALPHITVPALKDKSFRTDTFISGSIEKRIACSALSAAPYSDTSILHAWLSSEGYGKKLIKWISDYFEKTLREEAHSGGEERTSYISLLAAINTVRKKKEKLKGFRIKGIPYEKLDLTTGMILFITFREALQDTLSRLKEAGSTCYKPEAEALLASALVPRAFVLIPSNILSITINPYGVNRDIYESVSSHLGNILDGLDDLEGLRENASERIRHDAGLMEELRGLNYLKVFREKALAFLMEFDLPGSAANETLFELYNEDRAIRNFLGDARQVGALGKSLDEVREKYQRDPRRVEAIDSLASFIFSFNKKFSIASLLKPSRKESGDFVMPVVEACAAYALDDHIEKYGFLMRGYLCDRRGEFSQNMLLEEYNNGRLYRFSKDARPALKTLTLEAEGQLFIDMKDFTRRTLKVKEIAMAEFMKVHFYEPIISAASRYGVGAGVSKDERGIRLTNLPGDAAIFSGGVSYLVSLAKDIQTVIRRYREHLLKKLPPRREDELLEEVHRRFDARKKELRERRMALKDAIDRNEQGVEARLVTLGEEEHRLENNYRDEVEAALKGELEAGLYISYGSKAETIIIESKGDFSGVVKVSIAEKINEASRGTFRNSQVRAKLEILLEKERQVRKNPNLKYPFDIYIDRIVSIKLPPEADRAFEKVLSTRKESNAKAMAQLVANEYLNDLRKIISGEPFSSLRFISSSTDIYNKGQALSEDALTAYMNETRGTKVFFQRTVPVESLDQSIRDEFFFPNDTLEFWFGYEHVKGAELVEAFCKSGEIIFKGFEAATPAAVYEMLDVEGEFFKAIMKRHFHDWLEEARAGQAVPAPAN